MIKPNYISYKDSAARVVQKENKFYRYIFKNYKTEYDHLMASGLYSELTKKELLVTHEEISIEEQDPEVYKLILPKQIVFQSYPFEWSYRQWRKAILAYLTINQIALKYGMILKDATPYNFYINADKAVMFDTSSFVFFKENDKWLAYKQFCEEFLSPVALMHYNGQNWGRLYLSQLRGMPLSFVSKQLPIKTWLNLTVLLHVHLHAKYIKQPLAANKIEGKGFSLEKVNSMISLIKNSVSSWKKPYLFKNHWAAYYENDIETEAYLNSKEELIRTWVSATKPASILDLGANTGRFSFIASAYTERVIALESDESCVDEMDKDLSLKKNNKIFPLIGDLSDPSPGLGLLNKETTPIFERAKSEMVLGLALIHHLYFTKDMSFNQIAEVFSKLSANYLIVEFIPKEDRKVKGLIQTKPQRAQDYNLESFKASLASYFEHMDTKTLTSSTRILILLKKLDEKLI
jgi:hypothetical protein